MQWLMGKKHDLRPHIRIQTFAILVSSYPMDQNSQLPWLPRLQPYYRIVIPLWFPYHRAIIIYFPSYYWLVTALLSSLWWYKIQVPCLSYQCHQYYHHHHHQYHYVVTIKISSHITLWWDDYAMIIISIIMHNAIGVVITSFLSTSLLSSPMGEYQQNHHLKPSLFNRCDVYHNGMIPKTILHITSK